jgi:hypothetical protein
MASRYAVFLEAEVSRRAQVILAPLTPQIVGKNASGTVGHKLDKRIRFSNESFPG